MSNRLKSFLRRLAKFLLHFTDVKDISDADLEYLCWITSLYVRIQSVPGHIAEVGVADGRNTVLFGRLIDQFNDQSTRQYIGFDTFDGYSERDLLKDQHLSENAWKHCSEEAVLRRCKDNDVDALVELIKGDATKTVPLVLENHRGKKFQPGKAKFALLYIDCNAYEPSYKSIESFMPYMMPGAIIAIDEKLQGGESEALIAFARDHELVVKRGGSNQVPMMIELPQ